MLGLDLDEPALATARERARAQGLTHVDFARANLVDFRPGSPVDAVIGRHILIHSPDPVALVKTAFAALGHGGVGAFQEFDFTIQHAAYPRSPLRDRMLEICNCRAEYPILGGPDSPYYEWIAESLRSILPRAEALGLASSSDVGIDTLAERLREEAMSGRSGCPSPVMVGCVGRKS